MLELVVDNTPSRKLPLKILINEAIHCIQQGYGKNDYDMYIGYMSQFCSNAEDLTYHNWLTMIIRLK